MSAVMDPNGSSNPSAGNFCAFTTSNMAIATVNNIGEIHGVSPGTATITCKLASLTTTRTITVYSPTVTGTTWYVQPLGGTRYTAANPTGQCNGTTNANYPGSGTNQTCAFNNPMWCFTDNSSSSIYTGAVQSGDTCLIAQATYNTSGFTTTYVSGFVPPSGTPTHPTKILGANYATCTSPEFGIGNRSQILTPGQVPLFFIDGVQNFDIECMDIGSGQDCNGYLTGQFDFACPGSVTHNFAIETNSFTSNITLINDRIHGYMNALTGTPGPGIVVNNTSAEENYLDGWNFDDPYGYYGNRTDGFSATKLGANFSGCTEEQPKTVTSVSRSGGILTVVIPAGQIANYVTGTNIVLFGMTPSDLNGTFPITGSTFNQQTVTITGGTLTQEPGGSPPIAASFTTSTAPTFGQGAFVNILGVHRRF